MKCLEKEKEQKKNFDIDFYSRQKNTIDYNQLNDQEET